MKNLWSTISVSILMSGSAFAGDTGFFCADEGGETHLIVAFHETEKGYVALIDGDYSNPLPADLSDKGDPRASFEGPDFLAVLNENLELNALSKRNGLFTMTCTDITQAARTLNTDFDTLTALTDNLNTLTVKVSDLDAQLELARTELSGAQSDLKECENTKIDRLAAKEAESELVARIEELQKQNERLIANSRMWQTRIKSLEKQIQEQ